MKTYMCWIPAIVLLMLISCKTQTHLQNNGHTDAFVNEIIYDMTTPNTPPNGYPHGVPVEWDWQHGPVIQQDKLPAGFTAMIPWGVVYRDLTDSKDSNTRVELSNIKAYILSKSAGKWTLIKNDQVKGALYPEKIDEETTNPPISPNIRIEPSANPSCKIVHGRTWHHFPSSRVSIDSADFGGLYVIYSARLIIDNPTLPDDRAIAKYLMQAGGDWWRDLTAPFRFENGHYFNNNGIAVSRFKYITNQWSAIHMTTLNSDQLKSNPPPN
jgi:hypothetical protein